MKQPVVVALAGNPNSGKTTMFNALTGARQHVGNYPGITVEKKEGFLHVDGITLRVVDLPGTYSLTAYSEEELVARNFLVENRPDVVVDVLNAGALERNLYLAVQFMELGVPMVLALNMIDEAKQKGLIIDSQRLSALLNVPVVETVARTGMGKESLVQAVERHDLKCRGQWAPLQISYGPDLDPILANMAEQIEKEGFLVDRYPARWLALKYLEGDDEIRDVGRQAGVLAQSLENMAAQVAQHCKATLNTYPEAIIADYRYGYIASILKSGVLKREDRVDRLVVSDRIDQVLTHTFVGPLIMFAILFGVYQFTFTLGDVPMQWVEAGFAVLGDLASQLIPEGHLQSLVVSGVIQGVGGVVIFVPLIALMFLAIAILEDSGYMARVAYMLDRVFRLFGLHGCSVMPYIVSGGIAGGCAVPGVMATRTLRSPKEKLATLLTVPFMTCGAKVPVFILLVGVFFPAQQALAMFLITLVGWCVALLVARALRSTVIQGAATPFVMELPPYRWPTFQGLMIHTWERTWQYLKKAGTVILAISILLWAAMTFPGLSQDEERRFQMEEAKLSSVYRETGIPDQVIGLLQAEKAGAVLRSSLAGRLGQSLEGVSQWAGFDWRTNIALIGGFAAKEVIVATMGTAYSLGADMSDDRSLKEQLAGDPEWSALRAMALIVFILLYAPCFVTVVSIAREAGSWKWAGFSVVFNTVLAFVLSCLIYQGGLLLGVK